MFIVKIMQYERHHTLGIFDTEANALNFIKQIPHIEIEQYQIEGVEEPFTDYSINRENLPDYEEIHYRGKRVPITKHMFVPNERISVFVIPVVYMDSSETGMVDDATQVDAYLVTNEEVESYIDKREFLARKIMEEADARGFRNIERAYAGSEDGEAIIAMDSMGNSRFLTHLDASLVDQFEFNDDETLKRILKHTFE
ncbi:hypothetical protein GTU75_01050 [Erysipelothrix rhusiopathiae]|uniref:hypothetical protein n=1 Tax=Erysipelothrix sp. strain 2 (EsS2-7-Brazil) TaxID=2500579 RepID=UPI00137724FC|nr:hypothetical protein [Erysipelothrix sp. strain 2 (EsS2-7-Brazil)]MBK2403299.1 hypothetical protein [Erysipelothrix sp. strain 2 (EsS2-7-Brazil)]NBA00733.1 hypothetical protein [Erysipelothrix rhusiopathiae]